MVNNETIINFGDGVLYKSYYGFTRNCDGDLVSAIEGQEITNYLMIVTYMEPDIGIYALKRINICATFQV